MIVGDGHGVTTCSQVGDILRGFAIAPHERIGFCSASNSDFDRAASTAIAQGRGDDGSRGNRKYCRFSDGPESAGIAVMAIGYGQVISTSTKIGQILISGGKAVRAFPIVGVRRRSANNKDLGDGTVANTVAGDVGECAFPGNFARFGHRPAVNQRTVVSIGDGYPVVAGAESGDIFRS